MGVGHVPEEPLYPERESSQFQGRQRGGTPEGRSARRTSRVGARARGAWGEDLVARWYERHGFTVIARNWRIRDGELDIVAQKGRLVVVCEVKTRATNEFGTPAEAMTERKQFVVRRTAHHFIREHNLNRCSLRLDVASVVGSHVEVIVDAF